MSTRMASDEVTDGIAAIEVHRQGTEQESGLAVACDEALRKLQALLEEEKSALQAQGPDSVHAINVEVVAHEIRRVQSMVGGKGKAGKQRNAQRRNPPGPRVERPHNNAARNRGRRKLGRGGRGGRGNRGGEGNGGGGPGPGPR